MGAMMDNGTVDPGWAREPLLPESDIRAET